MAHRQLGQASSTLIAKDTALRHSQQRLTAALAEISRMTRALDQRSLTDRQRRKAVEEAVAARIHAEAMHYAANDELAAAKGAAEALRLENIRLADVARRSRTSIREELRADTMSEVEAAHARARDLEVKTAWLASESKRKDDELLQAKGLIDELRLGNARLADGLRQSQSASERLETRVREQDASMERLTASAEASRSRMGAEIEELRRRLRELEMEARRAALRAPVARALPYLIVDEADVSSDAIDRKTKEVTRTGLVPISTNHEADRYWVRQTEGRPSGAALGRPPTLVIMYGTPGSGKSRALRALIATLGWRPSDYVHLDPDELRYYSEEYRLCLSGAHASKLPEVQQAYGASLRPATWHSPDGQFTQEGFTVDVDGRPHFPVLAMAALRSQDIVRSKMLYGPKVVEMTDAFGARILLHPHTRAHARCRMPPSQPRRCTVEAHA